ncbi:MAG: M20 family peptidase, partial [Oscillospiraceae bacterium]|nr:M20 family peptidase [Oscillospiraceae bacterium]
MEPFIQAAVEKHHAEAVALSDDLYAHPEPPEEEFRSSEKIVAILRAAGYEVEYPYMGYPTGFRGVMRNGDGPSAGILVEYDALPGLGHACGH